jgi:hypothetical protein
MSRAPASIFALNSLVGSEDLRPITVYFLPMKSSDEATEEQVLLRNVTDLLLGAWSLKCTYDSVMARCYQCGIPTELYRCGSPLCEACQRKASPQSFVTIDQLNARLTEARDAYRKAVGAQTKAFELRPSLSPNHSDGLFAVQNTTAEVEEAAIKFREALRNVVTALSKRSD